jgi:hypothetical protein
MALAIKTPTDQATISTLYKLLVRERPINQGAQKENLYCVTQDAEGNLRLPMPFAKALWNLQLPDYTRLPRKEISCNIQLGPPGKEYQIPTYAQLVQSLISTHAGFLFHIILSSVPHRILR